jgi:hypothetical protein
MVANNTPTVPQKKLWKVLGLEGSCIGDCIFTEDVFKMRLFLTTQTE